jgi:hypothetical protein
LPTYRYFEIDAYQSEEAIDFYCTDPGTADSMLAELDKVFDFQHLETVGAGGKGYRLRKYGRDWHRPISMWLVQRLCAEGWEPFSTNMAVYGAGYYSKSWAFRMSV